MTVYASLVGHLPAASGFAQSIGAAETDLLSFVVKALSLLENGQKLWIFGGGYTAGTVTPKTIKLKLGAETIESTGAIALNGKNWSFDIVIERTGPATQFVVGRIGSNDRALYPDGAIYAALTRDLTTDLTFKVTGLGGADGDVVQRELGWVVLT